MSFVRIGKVNLVDAVYQQLHDKIISGELPEGTKLDSENKLAESFSVSRVVVREALQQLRSERLIVTRQGVGTYIANPKNFAPNIDKIDMTEETYRDFLHFRQSIEYSAVMLSKTTATDEDFDELDRCARRMEESTLGDDELNNADFDFHYAVVHSAHNIFLDNAMLANKQMMLVVFQAMNTLPEAPQFGKVSHHELARLMRERQPKAVIQAYERMGKYNIARLAAFFKK